MNTSRLLTGLALACGITASAGAQTYTFNVEYFGANVASLDPGSDNPIGTDVQPGDSFLWTISANGGSYWHVTTGGSFFPLMAFGVNESGTRTGDFTLSLLRNGSSVFSLTEVGSMQSFVHMGTNTVNLSTGLDFDRMELNYLLTDSYQNDYNNPQPSGPPTASTINGLLPIFGAPELNQFSPGIDYVGPTAAVPEPSTYALMVGGLGMLGVVARRRRASLTA